LITFFRYENEDLMSNSELKKAGLKSTVPRMQILDLLVNNKIQKHLSAEDVYKLLLLQDSDIGLATVYRVLTQFEQAGLVTRHHFDGVHSIFELNNGEHHDHLVCIKCGKVDEFYDESIEESQHMIAKKYDFKMTEHSLYLYGVCSQCQDDK
jgi:Fur family transcriptional regulator, ferric uptake regulator